MTCIEKSGIGAYSYGDAPEDSPHMAHEVSCFRCGRNFVAVYPEFAETIVKCPTCRAFPLADRFSLKT